MSVKRKALGWLLRNMNYVQRSMVAEDAAPTVTVPTKHGPIQIYCPAWPVANRVNGFHKKEPETLAWIDGLSEGGTLWDIGANIGVYSLYAAKRGLAVCAFEPSPMNFAVLAKNVAINKLGVETLCVALGDRTGIAHFRMGDLRFGQADAGLWANEQPLRVTALSYRLDDFADAFGLSPDFMKIDIDGAEDRLLAGSQKVLRGVRDLQIECPGTYETVARILSDLGFRHEPPIGPIRNVRFYR